MSAISPRSPDALPIDAISGGVKVDIVAGSLPIVVTPSVSSTANAPAQTTVGAIAGVILAANAAAKARSIKNTSVLKLYLGFGAAPSVTAYHFPLSACGTHDDGAGGAWNGLDSEGCLFQGDVYAIASAAGGTCVITEFT